MGKNANIYDINHNMDMLTICKLINTNFKSLAQNTQSQRNIIEKQTVISVHNDLTHRDDNDCHPIGSISNLADTITEVSNTLSNHTSRISNVENNKADKTTVPQKYKDTSYPVGIVVFTADNENPGSSSGIFGWGTWISVTLPSSMTNIYAWKRTA